jgi:hypothetical protein
MEISVTDYMQAPAFESQSQNLYQNQFFDALRNFTCACTAYKKCSRTHRLYYN